MVVVSEWYGTEMEWIIQGENFECSGRDYRSNSRNVISNCCIPESEDFTVTCSDSYGDGWDGGCSLRLHSFICQLLIFEIH